MNSRCLSISICGRKMSISGSLPVEITPEFLFWKIFIAPKVPLWNFRSNLFSYFSVIAFISAVIGILEYFGSLLPDSSVVVKWKIGQLTTLIKIFEWCINWFIYAGKLCWIPLRKWNYRKTVHHFVNTF